MDWDAEAFLKKLKAGEFDGSLNDELLRLSPDQIQELEQFLQRKNLEAWESAGKRKPGPEDLR
jgi:hypothetical protein